MIELDTPETTTTRAFRWPLLTLFGALLADLAETLVDPADSGAAARVYDASSAHEWRMIASAVLLLTTSVCAVPTVLGLVRSLGPRGRWLGRVAACLALLGAMGHAALSMLHLVWIQVPKGGADREQMLALLERITSAGRTVIVMPLIIAFPFCFLALFGALARGRVASRWISSCPSRPRRSARPSFRSPPRPQPPSSACCSPRAASWRVSVPRRGAARRARRPFRCRCSPDREGRGRAEARREGDAQGRLPEEGCDLVPLHAARSRAGRHEGQVRCVRLRIDSPGGTFVVCGARRLRLAPPLPVAPVVSFGDGSSG